MRNATEGIPLTNVPVAVFIDNSGVPLSSYTAAIDWGDGTITNGTVIATGSNTFEILGSHTYLNSGNYLLVASENNGTATLTANGVVTVADAPLQGFSQVINGQVGSFVSNALVAIFTDSDTTLRDSSHYSATIQWLEGNGISASSLGTIFHLFGNTFEVIGSSPFSIPIGGLSTVRVVIRDVGGASVTVDSVLNAPHNPAIPPYIPLAQLDSGPPTAQFVAMQDALTNLLLSEQRFMAALGFGTTEEKQAGFTNLLNAYFAYQAAVFQFDMHLPGS